jgi:glucoamylase
VITVTAQLDQTGQAGQEEGQGRPLQYARVQAALPQSSLTAIAQHMFSLMLRNVSSDGFVFADPLHPGSFSAPGCIIASPSFPGDLAIVDQDYVFNFTRDAAIAAVEIAAASVPARPGEGVQPLIDYVNFARTCQDNSGSVTIGHAAYTVEGQPRTDRGAQNDGPALQTLAILQAFPQLDASTQATAATVISTNLNYLLGPGPQGVPVFQSQTTNLWEEEFGFSFFARAVQLKCFQQVTANTVGIPVPPGTAAAITFLQNALQGHFTGQFYQSLIPPLSDGTKAPYDPNIDIVLSSLYGAVPLTDTKMLATAALIRRQWTDSSSSVAYPINAADQARGIGPVLGRYPGDKYDGDVGEPASVVGHPWALCTANFASLYYGLANTITQTQAVPFDNLSTGFFGQVGITASTPPGQAAANLQAAADQMLNALVFHSDHLELSEQFDKDTGFEKSVRDLTWSYASFLAAVRAKTGQNVLG